MQVTFSPHQKKRMIQPNDHITLFDDDMYLSMYNTDDNTGRTKSLYPKPILYSL